MTCPECGSVAAVGVTRCSKCGFLLAKVTAGQPTAAWWRRYGVAMLVASAVGVTATVVWYVRAPVPPPPPEPPVVVVPVEALDASGRQTSEFEEAERLANLTGQQLSEALRAYQKRTGRLPAEIGDELTDEQRQLLQDLATKERGSVRGLLQTALEKDQQLATLRQRVSELRGALPEHVVAAEGDRHDRIAMDYLSAKGVSKERIYDLLRQVNLQPNLLPGFRVWMLFDGRQFGTWVTQGEAAMSPQGLQERFEAVLAVERAENEKVVAGLRGEVDNLKDLGNIARLSDQELGSLRAELATAYAAAERLQGDIDRQRQESSRIHYIVGAKNALVGSQVIDKSLRVLAASGGTPIDVASGASIVVDGAVHGLNRIRRVTLAPEVFNAKVDYVVENAGPIATIRVLNPRVFLNHARLLVVVLE